MGLPIYSIKEEAKNLDNKKIIITHNFYDTDETMVRISLANKTVRSFFFFQINDVKNLNLSFFDVSQIDLGKDSYNDIAEKSKPEFINSSNNDAIYREASIIKTNYPNHSSSQYYSEWYSFGKAASYQTIVYGNLANKKNLNKEKINKQKIDDEPIIARANEIMLEKKQLENEEKDIIKNEKLTNSKNYFSIFHKPLDIKNVPNDFKNIIHSEYGETIPNVYGVIDTDYSEYIEIDSPKRDWLNIYNSWGEKRLTK